MARPAPAATRALAVLDLLAANPDEAFTLSEIAQRLGVGAASAHALLHAMSDADYVVRHPTRKTYTLGPATVAVGNAALDRHPTIAAAREEMRRLAEELDLECMASMRFRDEVVTVARAGRPHPHRPLVRVGDRQRMVPPLGSEYLAWSPPQEVDRWLDRLDPHVDPAVRKRHRAAVDGMRVMGYTVGVHVPRSPGVEVVPVTGSPCRLALRSRSKHAIAYVAAPVFGSNGEVVLVVNVDGFRNPLGAAEVVRVADHLRDAMLVLTRMTGGRPPNEVEHDT